VPRLGGRNSGAISRATARPHAELVLTSPLASGGRQKKSVSVERTGSVVKVKASIRRMCNQCQVVRRKGKVRVICKANPKHKQVQG